MRLIRFRLDRLMIWVAVAAINLAAFRVLFATRNLVYLAGGMTAWTLIQVGIFRAVRNRRGKRPYWLGFAAGGSVATLSIFSTAFLWGTIEGSIWVPYFALVQGLLERSEPWLVRLCGNGGAGEIAVLVLCVGAWILPIWLTALAGGRLCRLLFARSNPPAAMA